MALPPSLVFEHDWYASWQTILDDYDDAINTWSNCRLQSPELAKRAEHGVDDFFINDKSGENGSKQEPIETPKEHSARMMRLLAADDQLTTIYPYIDERLEYSIRESLDWMKNHPPTLREGLTALVEGRTPKNLLDVVAQYGLFRKYQGVLEAPDFLEKSAFESQRNSGKKSATNTRLKIYIASYVCAYIRQNRCTTEMAIKAFAKHARFIARSAITPPYKLSKKDFDKLLLPQKLQKYNESKTPLRKLDMKKFQALFMIKKVNKKARVFAPHLWAREHVVIEIIHFTLQSPK